MDLATIDWMKVDTEVVGGLKLKQWRTVFRLELKQKCTIVGVDPGRNFGISIIRPDDLVEMYVSKFPPMKRNEYGFFARDFFESFIRYQLYGETGEVYMGIEGPSFHDNFGQVVLAEIRMGFCVSAIDNGINPVQYAPMTSRKSILGKGTTKGSDLWVTVPDHGADSFVIALHVAKEQVK